MKEVHNVGSLAQLVRRRAAEAPDRVVFTFLRDGEERAGTLTFGELDRRARALGHHLLERDLGGETALLLYPSGLDFIVAFFACAYAGVIAVPAPPPDPRRLDRTLPRVEGLCADARTRAVLTTGEGAEFSRQVLPRGVRLAEIPWVATDGVEAEAPSGWEGVSLPSDAPAFLQYTSGSTSSPKGAIITHAGLLANSRKIRQAWGYDETSVDVVWVPNYHDDGLVHGILQAVYSGSHAVLFSPLAFIQRPVRWLRAITGFGATHSGGPNFAYELCSRKVGEDQLDGLDLSTWRLAYNAAEPIRWSTLTRFRDRFEPAGFAWSAFCPSYGLAEATLLVTGVSDDQPPRRLELVARALDRDGRVEIGDPGEKDTRSVVGCGRPVPGCDLRIVDPETGEPCAPDEVGEVWIDNGCLAAGYWNREEATREALEAELDGRRYLRSGDLGFLHDGELFLTGRIKDLIIIRGENRSPQDIEWSAQDAHHQVRPGAVVAFSTELDDQEVLIVVAEVREEAAGDSVVLEEVREAIREAIAAQHDLLAREICFIRAGTILKTSSGKLQRQATRRQYLGAELDRVDRPRPRPSEEAPSPARVESGRPGLSEEALRTFLLDELAGRLGRPSDDLDPDKPFAALGIDSLMAVEVSGDLSDRLGAELSPTLFWEFPTVNELVRHLAGSPTRSVSPAQSGAEPIAVVGMACRFPGAEDPEAYWQLLRDGVDAIREIPSSRFDVDAYYSERPAAGKMYTRQGGFLDGIEDFDADFFGIRVREAIAMDPQHRLMLEVCWEALEDAGEAPDRLVGSETGVFAGISTNEYADRHIRSGEPELIDPYATTGSLQSLAVGRVSHLLDLQGPAMAVDTACSSSLLAVHLACESLWTGRSRMVLAGGVNLILSPEFSIALSRVRALSVDGRCRAFSQDAQGYGRGEGCGMVVLKRLSDALTDGNRIVALIRGTAVNHDGLSNGLTAPNGQAQRTLLRKGLAHAGISPADVGLLEMHGTGTPLGDPIEVEAAAEVLGAGRSPDRPVRIGSVKSNFGHLESAAGVAGLMKAILSLEHRAIPPSLHVGEPNRRIAWDRLPVAVATELQAWESDAERLAGVSSFGFTGTNVHIVLSEGPRAEAEDEGGEDEDTYVLPISARSQEALRDLARAYADRLKVDGGLSSVRLRDVAYTAGVGRSHHRFRAAIVGDSGNGIAESLEAFAAGEESDTLAGERPEPFPETVFWLSGGPATTDLARDLVRDDETCQTAARELDPLLQRRAGLSLHEALRPEGPELPPPIAGFVVPLLLTSWWQARGIVADAWVGGGAGEAVAAYRAGALSLDDALALSLEEREGVPDGGSAAWYSLGETGQPTVDGNVPAELSARIDAVWASLLDDGFSRVFEIGAHRLAERGSPAAGLEGDTAGGPEVEAVSGLTYDEMLAGRYHDALATLYVRGHAVEWRTVCKGGHFIPLPTYRWQRRRLWLDHPSQRRDNTRD